MRSFLNDKLSKPTGRGKLKRLGALAASVALLALLSFTWTTDLTAVAQQAAEVIEEVVVIAAPIERRWTERGKYGGEVEVIELTRRVSYADLDLSKQADVTVLETRIETAAKDSCEKLSEMFPLSPSDNAEIRRCINKASDGTEEQVQAAIAAAQ